MLTGARPLEIDFFPLKNLPGFLPGPNNPPKRMIVVLTFLWASAIFSAWNNALPESLWGFGESSSLTSLSAFSYTPVELIRMICFILLLVAALQMASIFCGYKSTSPDFLLGGMAI